MEKIRNNPFGNFLLLLLFWMCFFALNRAIFLVYQQPLLKEAGISDMLLSYWYGWRLDLSMTAYLLAIPFLFLGAQQFVRQRWISKAMYWYAMLISLVISVIVASELELFVEWGVKLNRKAIFFLENPTEVVSIASNQLLLTIALLILLQWTAAKRLYKGLLNGSPDKYENPWVVKIGFLLLIPCLIVLMLRGGLQQIPINQSVAYYSQNNVLNNAAVNSAWNTAFSLLKAGKYSDRNPYDYFEQEQAEQVIASLYDFPGDSTTQILNKPLPNVVMVILEGWSSDLVGSLGGYDSITPEFDRLSKEGLLFTNIYAAGMRSHEGMAAIFSGYPAQPVAELTAQPDKYPGIPVIIRPMEKKGYNTFYGFGGDLNYGNIKSYLVYAGIDKLIDEADFPDELPRAKLGVHDENAFPRFIEEIGQLSPPFFASWFTVSSHAPYDIPEPYSIDINGLEVGYLNSVHYTDKHLGKFFEAARKQPWYDETLFIVVSDHGHSSPMQHNYYDPAYRKIPLLLYGNVLKENFRGQTLDRIGSQTDIAATLLSMLGMDDAAYRWSKNLLNPSCPEFAYYGFDDGMGWVEPGNYFSYHHELNSYFVERFENEQKKQAIIEKGKSYLQAAFQDYLNL